MIVQRSRIRDEELELKRMLRYVRDSAYINVDCDKWQKG